MPARSPAFDIEKEMWIPATKWIVGQGMGLKREFRLPWGICDLVGVEWAQRRVSDRRLKGQIDTIGPPGRIALLELVPAEASGRSITVDQLRALLGRPLQSVMDEVAVLSKGNFIKRREDGSFVSSFSWDPLHIRIVAVELKLDRIDEALNQARSHYAFATESFVAFPQLVAERIVSSRRVHALRDAGIGLLSVSEAGSKSLVDPIPSCASLNDPILQVHCVERFWTQITDKVA